MRKIGFFFVSLITANTVFAQTSPLSYDYVQAGYGEGEILDEDFSFIGVGGSFSINESFFVTGSYSDGETDDSFGPGLREIEFSSYDIGLGFHTPVNETIDFVVSGSYISSELEFGGFSDDGDGYGIGGGFRFKPSDRLELNAFVDYADLGNEDGADGTSFSASAYYFFVPSFSLGLTYANGDDTDSFAGSIRFHF